MGVQPEFKNEGVCATCVQVCVCGCNPCSIMTVCVQPEFKNEGGCVQE